MNRIQKTNIYSHLFLLFMVSLCLALPVLPGCKKEQKAGPPPATDVEVVDVNQKDVAISSEYIGTADGFVNATIRAQVQGYLMKRNYREGDFVMKGQVLFEIDPRTFEAALEQARGQLAAQQARWDTTKANLKRIKPLAELNAVSQKDLDDSIGAEQAAHAAVIAAQAAVDKAKVDLGFTEVISPINGIAGIAKAQIGNLVGPGQIEELTTVSTVNPIKVYVPISEQEYLLAMERSVERKKKGEPQREVDMILADGNLYPHKGTLSFADRQVDPTTGTIKIAFLFPNPGNILRPGQYAKVRAIMQTIKGALVVPQRAVNELQGNFQVAVVGSDNKVSVRTVKPGVKTGSLMVITEGLQPGERVVVEGLQKVKDGMTVNPKMVSLESLTEKPAASAAKPAAPQGNMPVAGHEQ